MSSNWPYNNPEMWDEIYREDSMSSHEEMADFFSNQKEGERAWEDYVNGVRHTPKGKYRIPEPVERQHESGIKTISFIDDPEKYARFANERGEGKVYSDRMYSASKLYSSGKNIDLKYEYQKENRGGGSLSLTDTEGSKAERDRLKKDNDYLREEVNRLNKIVFGNLPEETADEKRLREENEELKQRVEYHKSQAKTARKHLRKAEFLDYERMRQQIEDKQRGIENREERIVYFKKLWQNAEERAEDNWKKYNDLKESRYAEDHWSFVNFLERGDENIQDLQREIEKKELQIENAKSSFVSLDRRYRELEEKYQDLQDTYRHTQLQLDTLEFEDEGNLHESYSHVSLDEYKRTREALEACYSWLEDLYYEDEPELDRALYMTRLVLGEGSSLSDEGVGNLEQQVRDLKKARDNLRETIQQAIDILEG